MSSIKVTDKNLWLSHKCNQISSKSHYENLHMQYTDFLVVTIENFIGKILIFFIFLLKNIDCVDCVSIYVLDQKL